MHIFNKHHIKFATHPLNDCFHLVGTGIGMPVLHPLKVQFCMTAGYSAKTFYHFRLHKAGNFSSGTTLVPVNYVQVPMQHNTFDCGIHAMKTILRLYEVCIMLQYN